MNKAKKILLAMIFGLSMFINCSKIKADDLDVRDTGDIGDTGAAGGTGSVSTGDVTDDTDTTPVQIPDANLASALKEATREDKALTKGNLAKVTTLSLPMKEISNLSGIENCVNLTSIDVSNNHITDFSPLLKLSKLSKATIGDQTIEVKDKVLNYTEGKELKVTPIALTNVDGTKLVVNDVITPENASISADGTEISIQANDLEACQNISYSMAGKINFSSGISSDYTITVTQPIHKEDKVVDTGGSKDTASTDNSVVSGSTGVTKENMSAPKKDLVNNKKDEVSHKIGKKKVSINISEKKYEILRNKKEKNISKFRQIIKTVNLRDNNGVITFYRNIGEDKSMKQVMYDCDFFNQDVFSSIVEYDPLRTLKVKKNIVSTGDTTNNNLLFFASGISLLVIFGMKSKMKKRT